MRPRIFINGMNALQGGGQTYLVNLLLELPAADIFLAVPAELQEIFRDHEGLTLIHFGAWNKTPLHRFFWENWVLPRLIKKLGIHVYFSAGGLLPWRDLPCKTVSAFRNMLPFSDVDRRKFPLGPKRARYALLKVFLIRAFQRADAVIFISHYAKQVIDRVLPKRRGLSQVIYHGVGEPYRRTEPMITIRPKSLPFAYVLYVSILNVYKSQLEVVEAWAQLRLVRKTTEKLILLGPEYGPYAEKVRALIARLGLVDEVLLPGKIPYAELPAYYHHAKLNIFASTCENCPNILLEALASRRPVLCSNIEPMPEIAAGSARLFSPFIPLELTQSLRETLDNPQKIEEMSERAAKRGADFSWANTRAQTWALLLRVADGK